MSESIITVEVKTWKDKRTGRVFVSVDDLIEALAPLAPGRVLTAKSFLEGLRGLKGGYQDEQAGS